MPSSPWTRCAPPDRSRHESDRQARPTISALPAVGNRALGQSRRGGRHCRLRVTTWPRRPHNDIDRQLPAGDEIFLDHVGHFVRDAEAASRALARGGFAPTPISIQVNPNPVGGVSPTGTGNITAMLSRGYIEVLFKTADTLLGREFDAALARHAGLHLAAFAVADAEKAHQRLAADGFRVRAAGAHAAPGRNRSRRRHRGLHHRARRTRRHARGPHPDADPSYRAGGMATALAFASEYRHRPDRRRHCGRRSRRSRATFCAFYRPRGDPDAGRRTAAPRPRRRVSRQP